MLQGQHGAGSFASVHGEDLTPLTTKPPSSPALADSIRVLRETTPSRPNILPSRQDPRGGPRKPIPSPLQQQSTQRSFSRDDKGPHSPRSPVYAPSSNQEEPRSPREKLEALLATEDTDISPQAAATTPTVPRTVSDRIVNNQPKISSYAQLRNCTAPVLSSAGLSPPASPVAMPPSLISNRPEPRPSIARNASIDSAVSSLSSNASQSYRSNASHMYKSSQDSAASANPPDMTSLILSAGSPEAALLSLWKEKQSASAHNAQLWRLVEKQRAMILGLNKDLERALKDKERYRKKLKEHLAQVPPLPNATQRPALVPNREHSQSPALSDRAEEGSIRSNSIQDTDAPKSVQKAPGQEQEAPPSRPYHQAHSADSPILPQDSVSAAGSTKGSASSEASPAFSPTPFQVAPLQIKQLQQADRPSTPAEKAQTASGGSGELQTISQSAALLDEEISPKSMNAKPAHPSTSPTRKHTKTPSLSLTHATPPVGTGSFASSDRSSQPLRKAPPAPLNLSQPNRASSHLHQSELRDDSDSEYDDILEVEEIPHFDRGRRKTREEDDRLREAMVQKEQEARSRSKKKSKSKSKSKPPSEQVSSPDDKSQPASEPPSIRSFSPEQGLPVSPRLAQAPGSINALLSPTTSDSFMIAQRSGVSPPLLSPGLPISPRPGDRPPNSPAPRMPNKTLASPPMSPLSGLPLSPRAPKQPIPVPPMSPLSFTSPHLARAEAYAHQSNQQAPWAGGLKVPSEMQSSEGDKGSLNGTESEQIYRGLVSDQYPGLLLPPNALPSIDVKVFSSRLRPSRLSFMAPKPQEEDPVFILAIYARSDGKQLWRVEKTIMALPALDQQVKSLCEFNGEIPPRSLFTGHAPAKIDARRAALNSYFDALLDTPMGEKAALVVCAFLSTDVIGAQVDESPNTADSPASSTPSASKSKSRKEGYLTKRGKNFGGWKARYFILDGPELRYYETAGGAHLGTIKLLNAQIGKQSPQNNQSPSRQNDDVDNQYRHAFLILEPKRKDSNSLVRHVLCAESDEERDVWVETLLQYVEPREDQHTSPVESTKSAHFQKGSQDSAVNKIRHRESPDGEKRPTVQALSYDDTVAAEAPVKGPSYSPPLNGSFISDNSSNKSIPPHAHPSISGPTNGAVIQDAAQWGNKPATSTKDKKRSIFGFRGRSSSDLEHGQGGKSTPQPMNRMPENRVVFGIPLSEAVECSQPLEADLPLPAVVYRSLEYLRAKRAESEEGIFRLSGSNIVIKALRDRFNSEGDVRLLDGQYYDVHAVASLLKLYLRELPTSILTRELHIDFLKVLGKLSLCPSTMLPTNFGPDLDERDKKISAFNVLVHKLPRVNLELLQALSSFLIEIINNADVNKMTVRNGK